MQRESVSLVLLGGLLAVLVTALLAFGRLLTLDARVAAALDHKGRIEIVQQLTEVVTRPDGRQVTVTTTRQDDETVAAFIARHDAVVAALKTDG